MKKDLDLAEAAYYERLLLALRRCVDGQWGLFGANDAAHTAHFGADRIPHSDEVIELTERADHIAQLRTQLGYTDPFALHERFMAYRKIASGANAHGEPRLAQQFLGEIDREPF